MIEWVNNFIQPAPGNPLWMTLWAVLMVFLGVVLGGLLGWFVKTIYSLAREKMNKQDDA